MHHGNGTQEIFEADPSVLFVSLHRNIYPHTGAVDDVGKDAGEGKTVNVPWTSKGMRNGDYLAAFNMLILPIAHGAPTQGAWSREGLCPACPH